MSHGPSPSLLPQINSPNICRSRSSPFKTGHTPTTEKARSFIQEVKSRYPDGRHHCYAFAIGHGASVTHGMGDDGEPSGTAGEINVKSKPHAIPDTPILLTCVLRRAGRPMLSVLTGTELGDCCVVVTRYFGGTKLGTGGLVKAYTEATQVCMRCRRVLCFVLLSVVYWGTQPLMRCRRVATYLRRCGIQRDARDSDVWRGHICATSLTHLKPLRHHTALDPLVRARAQR